ncbi:uncharacterized protein LOC110831850 [Zootermopsis nevadensis]|uniref:uncharacterized protein LOC110831850 n=1 Tax=Zootermopsis nevadensis TaxID=136037 RepID=UPI000B8E9647|nr:uncharacterized protein LOC110831850 [Zootermopsis nevadensis]
MFANRFATDHYNCNTESDSLYLQANDSTQRPIKGSKRQKHPDSPRDFLANRVSFYMDDILPSSNDEADGSALDLRYKQSIQRLQHPRILMTRERSFRVGERKPVRLVRHASDVCPSTRPQRLQRNRSINGSRRTPRRRDSYGGTIERSEIRPVVRCFSYRSTGSGNGRIRRQNSSSIDGGSKRSSTRRESCHLHRNSSFKLPHKELHPKERRRRIVVLMVISTFLFLVVCSVLAVVVTLTHSSFHRNSYYLPESTQRHYPRINYTGTDNLEQSYPAFVVAVRQSPMFCAAINI